MCVCVCVCVCVMSVCLCMCVCICNKTLRYRQVAKHDQFLLFHFPKLVIVPKLNCTICPTI